MSWRVHGVLRRAPNSPPSSPPLHSPPHPSSFLFASTLLRIALHLLHELQLPAKRQCRRNLIRQLASAGDASKAHVITATPMTASRCSICAFKLAPEAAAATSTRHWHCLLNILLMLVCPLSSSLPLHSTLARHWLRNFDRSATLVVMSPQQPSLTHANLRLKPAGTSLPRL